MLKLTRPGVETLEWLPDFCDREECRVLPVRVDLAFDLDPVGDLDSALRWTIQRVVHLRRGRRQPSGWIMSNLLTGATSSYSTPDGWDRRQVVVYPKNGRVRLEVRHLGRDVVRGSCWRDLDALTWSVQSLADHPAEVGAGLWNEFLGTEFAFMEPADGVPAILKRLSALTRLPRSTGADDTVVSTKGQRGELVGHPWGRLPWTADGLAFLAPETPIRPAAGPRCQEGGC